MERLNNSSTTARDVRLELLEKITGGFSKEHEIGIGGYGKVYKGVLNGKEIAVKKLHWHLALDDVIFKNESENLMRVQHQNIVEFVGYCNETRHICVEHKGRTVPAEMVYRVLCFEYLQNGSLDTHLYEEHRGFDWCTRYKIIKDENMVPKIADFGLSRLFGGTHTLITKNPVGTKMYMPPEYANEGRITKKYDVFSLGVIIIQIMTGREGCSKYWEMSSQQFIELVHQNWKVRVEATSMHTSAREDCKQVKRCIEIALNCVETEREKRPTIGDIMHKLREIETVTHEVLMPFSQESGSSHFKTEMVQNWSQEKQRGGQVKDSSNQQCEVLQKQSGMQQKDSSNEQPGSLEKEYQEDTKKHAASGIYEVSMPLSQELESVSRQFEKAVAHNEKEVSGILSCCFPSKKKKVRSELKAMKEERGAGGGKQDMAERLPPDQGAYDGNEAKQSHFPNGMDSYGRSLHPNGISSQHKSPGSISENSEVSAHSLRVSSQLDAEHSNRRAHSSSGELFTASGRGGDSASMDARSLQNGEDGYKSRGTISLSSNQVQTEWVEQCEPGVYITLTPLPDGTRDLKRVRFSRKLFSEHQAENWWSENREKVRERYNVRSSERVSSAASKPGQPDD